MITGHLNRLGTREDVLVQREYMHDIRDAAQHALELTEGKRDMSRDLVGMENIYVYFKTMYDAAAAEAAQPVIEKWSPRLGGVDTFAVNHTFIMYQSLRLDSTESHTWCSSHPPTTAPVKRTRMTRCTTTPIECRSTPR